jgi:hypothetical protein
MMAGHGCFFRLSSLFAFEGAGFHVVLIENGFGDSIGRTVETSLGLRFGATKRPASFRRAASHYNLIEADGNYDARPDIRAAPFTAAAPENPAHAEVGMIHQVARSRRVG